MELNQFIAINCNGVIGLSSIIRENSNGCVYDDSEEEKAWRRRRIEEEEEDSDGNGDEDGSDDNDDYDVDDDNGDGGYDDNNDSEGNGNVVVSDDFNDNLIVSIPFYQVWTTSPSTAANQPLYQCLSEVEHPPSSTTLSGASSTGDSLSPWLLETATTTPATTPQLVPAT